MKCIRTIKEEIFPTEEQKQKILQTLGCCRFVYNYMLSRNRKAYERRKEPVMNAFAMCNLLPHLKQVYSWLREADSRALQQSCRRLSVAYNKFFKEKKGYPKFKSRKCPVQSYTVTGIKISHITDSFVKLPSLGRVKWNPKRKVGFVHTSATILVKDDRYFVCLVTETENKTVPIIVSDNEKVIGLDYKSDGLYMDSNGHCADMPHYYRKSQKVLAKKQRKLSKKKLHSNNWYKQQFKVNKTVIKTARQRTDFLHKESRKIANSYDFVSVEDLNMKGMSQSLKLGKATMDNGYGKFIDMLAYKLEAKGGRLIKTDKWFPSSQLCSKCGSIKKIPLSQRIYICECGNIIDRDFNSAINIALEGRRIVSA